MEPSSTPQSPFSLDAHENTVSAILTKANACTAKEIVAKLQKTFECSICLDLLSDPLSTSCNHQFCRQCIIQVVKSSDAVCPLCKHPISKRSLNSNPSMNELLNALKDTIEAARKDLAGISTPPRTFPPQRSSNTPAIRAFALLHPTPQKAPPADVAVAISPPSVNPTSDRLTLPRGISHLPSRASLNRHQRPSIVPNSGTSVQATPQREDAHRLAAATADAVMMPPPMPEARLAPKPAGAKSAGGKNVRLAGSKGKCVIQKWSLLAHNRPPLSIRDATFDSTGLPQSTHQNGKISKTHQCGRCLKFYSSKAYLRRHSCKAVATKGDSSQEGMTPNNTAHQQVMHSPTSSNTKALAFLYSPPVGNRLLSPPGRGIPSDGDGATHSKESEAAQASSPSSPSSIIAESCVENDSQCRPINPMAPHLWKMYQDYVKTVRGGCDQSIPAHRPENAIPSAFVSSSDQHRATSLSTITMEEDGNHSSSELAPPGDVVSESGLRKRVCMTVTHPLLPPRSMHSTLHSSATESDEAATEGNGGVSCRSGAAVSPDTGEDELVQDGTADELACHTCQGAEDAHPSASQTLFVDDELGSNTEAPVYAEGSEATRHVAAEKEDYRLLPRSSATENVCGEHGAIQGSTCCQADDCSRCKLSDSVMYSQQYSPLLLDGVILYPASTDSPTCGTWQSPHNPRCPLISRTSAGEESGPTVCLPSTTRESASDDETCCEATPNVRCSPKSTGNTIAIMSPVQAIFKCSQEESTCGECLSNVGSPDLFQMDIEYCNHVGGDSPGHFNAGEICVSSVEGDRPVGVAEKQRSSTHLSPGRKCSGDIDINSSEASVQSPGPPAKVWGSRKPVAAQSSSVDAIYSFSCMSRDYISTMSEEDEPSEHLLCNVYGFRRPDWETNSVSSGTPPMEQSLPYKPVACVPVCTVVSDSEPSHPRPTNREATPIANGASYVVVSPTPQPRPASIVLSPMHSGSQADGARFTSEASARISGCHGGDCISVGTANYTVAVGNVDTDETQLACSVLEYHSEELCPQSKHTSQASPMDTGDVCSEHPRSQHIGIVSDEESGSEPLFSTPPTQLEKSTPTQSKDSTASALALGVSKNKDISVQGYNSVSIGRNMESQEVQALEGDLEKMRQEMSLLNTLLGSQMVEDDSSLSDNSDNQVDCSEKTMSGWCKSRRTAASQQTALTQSPMQEVFPESPVNDPLPPQLLAASSEEQVVWSQCSMHALSGQPVEAVDIPSPSPSHICQDTSPTSAASNGSSPPKRMSFVTHGLDKEHLLMAKALVRSSGGRIASKFNGRTTHVIVAASDGIAPMSWKYLQGIAAGVWVVSSQWIADSFKEGQLLPELDYEIRGDEHGHAGSAGKARLAKAKGEKMLEGIAIQFHSSVSLAKRDVLAQTMELAGASVLCAGLTPPTDLQILTITESGCSPARNSLAGFTQTVDQIVQHVLRFQAPDPFTEA